MKALVVGGTGFTGPDIVNGLLERGCEVTVLNRGVHKDPLPPEVERIRTDPHWLEPLKEAMEGRYFDVVISTYGRLRHVAEAAKGHTGRLISVGGEAVFKGWLRVTDPAIFQKQEPSPIPVPEEGFLEERGVDHFIDRMLETEELIMQNHQEGFYNATHFRYSMGYGPRHLAPPEWSVIRRVLAGRKQFVLPNGGQVIVCKGYGENEAHALLLAVDNPDVSAGQIYNISDETKLTNLEWVKMVAAVMDHEFEFVDMPLCICLPGYGYAYPPSLIYPYHQIMDITKVKEQLGYKDKVPTPRAIEKTVNWLLENRPEPGGEEERNLMDPFDFEAEDRLIRQLTTTWERLREEAVGIKYVWAHPYPHPQKRGDLK
ncbi:NAD-dependent epimerase/dehydratase family protein [Chloroflexota bacterium]